MKQGEPDRAPSPAAAATLEGNATDDGTCLLGAPAASSTASDKEPVPSSESKGAESIPEAAHRGPSDSKGADDLPDDMPAVDPGK